MSFPAGPAAAIVGPPINGTITRTNASAGLRAVTTGRCARLRATLTFGLRRKARQPFKWHSPTTIRPAAAASLGSGTA